MCGGFRFEDVVVLYHKENEGMFVETRVAELGFSQAVDVIEKVVENVKFAIA